MTKSTTRNLAAAVVLSGALIASLIGCGLTKTTSSGSAACAGSGVTTSKGIVSIASTTATSAGQAYFVKNVYPLLNKGSKCAQCHAPGGQKGDDPLADPGSSSNAYNNAINHFTPSNVYLQYDIYNQISTDHCGSAACQDPDGSILTALKGWASAELGGSSGGGPTPEQCTPQHSPGGSTPTPTPTGTAAPGYTTVGSVSIDSGLVDQSGNKVTIAPTDSTTVAYAQFDLSPVGGSGKVIFSIQRYEVTTTSPAYMISNASAMLSTAAHITGVQLVLSNAANAADSNIINFWTGVNTDVNTSTTFPGIVFSIGSNGMDSLIIPQYGNSGDTLTLAVQSVGPTNGTTQGGGPTPTPTPVNNAVSFAQTVQPILKASCAGCHSAGAGGWTTGATAAYASVTATDVTKGNSAASNLYLVLLATNPPGGSQMPKGGNPLNTTQITAIKTWIDQGAQNN